MHERVVVTSLIASLSQQLPGSSLVLVPALLKGQSGRSMLRGVWCRTVPFTM